MQETMTKPIQDKQTAEWQTVRLGDLGKIITGKTPPTTDPENFNGPYPFITIPDLNDLPLIRKTERTISEKGLSGVRSNLLPPNAVMMSCIATIGKCGVTTRPSITNQQINSIICNERVEPRFLYYNFKTLGAALEGAGGGGSVYTNVSKNRFADIEISLPSLSEQRSIASILGSLDDKIELNRQMNETLEQVAQALFKSWFVDFDPVRAKVEGRDTGLPKEIADLFPDSFEDSELGEIPKGWKVGQLSDIAKNLRRSIQPEQIDSSTPYIGLEHMPRHSIALSDWAYASELESNKFEYKRGEILFGKLRPYFHKVGIAPLDGVCSTDILVIAPMEKEWFGFSLGHLSSEALVSYTAAGSTGTKMPRTSWSEMARYPIVLPTKSIAAIFSSFVEPSVEKITANIHESKAISTIRDLLLPKFLSGEIHSA